MLFLISVFHSGIKIRVVFFILIFIFIHEVRCRFLNSLPVSIFIKGVS